MNKLSMILVSASLMASAEASANHIYTDTPFESYGECESMNARLSNDDAVRQFALRPDLFSSLGEARSVLTRAFACEYDPDDDAWYLIDYRREVLNSEWFLRRR